MYTVYLLESSKSFIHWKLIGTIQVKTRKEAMQLEKNIKNLKKRELQLKYFNNRPGSEK
jgi:predicted GIY-YIG superfamily endonuclease